MSLTLSSPAKEVADASAAAAEVVRIVVGAIPNITRANAGRAVADAAASLDIRVDDCRAERLYFLAQNPGAAQIERLCTLLLADPVTEYYSWSLLESSSATEVDTDTDTASTVEVAFRPGVTDIPARELARGMVEIGLPACEVATGTRYTFSGSPDEATLRRLAKALLCNGTIEHFSLGAIAPHFGEEAAANVSVERVSLAGLDDATLIAMSNNKAKMIRLMLLRTGK